MRRPQFTLRALLVLMLAVACFFGGIRFERERQRRKEKAYGLTSEEEARERALRELFLQEQKVDQLMARFNALMANEPNQVTVALRGPHPPCADR